MSKFVKEKISDSTALHLAVWILEYDIHVAVIIGCYIPARLYLEIE
jgi:hypothetical protein